MEGADAIVEALRGNGIDLCFANPGTTELNLVGAFARQSEVRYVPTLFEGVAIGAADGFYRISGRPAAALIHTGAGLANCMSNFLNARKSGSAMLTLVGDHPDELLAHVDAIASGVDIEEAARSYGCWTRRIRSTDTIAETICDAVAAASGTPGRPAAVVVPADVAWSRAEKSEAAGESGYQRPRQVPEERISEIADVLRKSASAALMLGSQCTNSEADLASAGRVAASVGCRLISRPSAILRGAGRVAVEALPYPPLLGVAALKDLSDLVLVGAQLPAMPWAYPQRDRVLMTAEGTRIHILAAPDEHAADALARLADEIGTAPEVLQEPLPQEPATGEIDPDALARSIAALVPDHAVLVDEAVTSGRSFYARLTGSRPHSWLNNLGGAIGWGQPAALGCALAAPARKVIALQGDGAAMYMPQSLWSIAREEANVLCVVFANRKYKVLQGDLEARSISGADSETARLMRVDDPHIGWARIAEAFGISASSVSDMNGFNREFEKAANTRGPSMIVVEM